MIFIIVIVISLKQVNISIVHMKEHTCAILLLNIFKIFIDMPAILKIIKKVNGNNKKEDRRKKKRMPKTVRSIT